MVVVIRVVFKLDVDCGCRGWLYRTGVSSCKASVGVCPADVSYVVANVGAERYFERDGERQGKK
jgi:hypothetical protein